MGCRSRGSLIVIAAAVVATATTASAPAALPTAAEVERAADRFVERHGTSVNTTPVRPVRGPATAPLPANLVLSLYGAPQMGQTILGRTSPQGAARKLARQASPYEELGERPVTGAFDLVSVFATAGGGPDGLYRSRQDDQVIGIYLEQARAVGARLMLDIQPGRATFVEELRELREWVAQPDVDIGIDPEWNVGPRGIPGRTPGRVSARQVRKVQRSLAATVAAKGLPPKLLVVHQFRAGSIRGRKRIRERDGVQTVLNFDGIGAPAAKQAGYEALSVPSLFDGFSLFYRRDRPLMRPPSVLALEPEAEFLLYQ